jgi:hypothetical protein
MSAGGTASAELIDVSATWLPAPSTTGKPGPARYLTVGRAPVSGEPASAIRTWTDVPFAGSIEVTLRLESKKG